jgi:hypothetical protein
MLGNSSVAAQLTAFQEGLSSMELVSITAMYGTLCLRNLEVLSKNALYLIMLNLFRLFIYKVGQMNQSLSVV